MVGAGEARRGHFLPLGHIVDFQENLPFVVDTHRDHSTTGIADNRAW